MDGLIRDLRFGARTLSRTPGLLIVGAFSLALGIVASLAGFIPARRASLVDPVRALKSD